MDCTFPIAAPPSLRRPLFFDLTLSIMHARPRPLPSRAMCKTNVISPFRCRRRRRKKSALINAAAESKQTAAFEDGQAGRRTRTPRTRTEPAGGRDGLERMIFPRSGARACVRCKGQSFSSCHSAQSHGSIATLVPLHILLRVRFDPTRTFAALNVDLSIAIFFPPADDIL